MSMTMTRRLIAGTSAAAVAAGMAVTLGVGSASAGPASANATAGPWKITRSISDTTPKAGQVITVLNTLKWTNANLPTVTALKDVHDPCLTLVPNSVKRNGGGGWNPEVAPDFVKISFSEVYSQYKDAMTFEVQYTVGQNCARDVGLQSTVHMAGNLSSGQSPSNIGPAITIAKNLTEMSITDVRGAEVGKAVRLEAQVRGSLAGDKVVFLDGATPIGTGTTNAQGWASVEWTPTSAGSKTINVEYAATPFANAKSGSKAASVAQSNVASTTILAADPAQVGRASNLTATVSPANAGGIVEFSVAGARVGSAPVGANGKAVYSWTPAGAGQLAVDAKFLGGNGVSASDATLRVEVAQKPAGSVASSMFLRVDGTPQVGVPINLIANVDPKDAGGTVAFSVNGVQVGSAPVGDGGVAIFVWTPTEAGTKDLSAAYSGGPLVDASGNTAVTAVAPGTGGPGTDPGAGSLGSLGGMFGSLGN